VGRDDRSDPPEVYRTGERRTHAVHGCAPQSARAVHSAAGQEGAASVARNENRSVVCLRHSWRGAADVLRRGGSRIQESGRVPGDAFGRGFVVRESGKFSIRSFQLGIDSCQRDDAQYMLPLGVMSLPTGVYWIAQTSSWTHETYDIIDIGPDPDMATRSTPGGGC